MQRLAEIAEAIAGTTKKLQKTALLAEYLKSRPPEEAALSTIFLSGRVFPAYEEATLQVGGSLLWKLVEELSGKTQQELTDSYRRYGDLGAVAGEVLPARPLATGPLSIAAITSIGQSLFGHMPWKPCEATRPV